MLQCKNNTILVLYPKGRFTPRTITIKAVTTPSRLQRTSGDESRRCCRLASASVGPKSCARTHRTDYSRRQTNTCVLRMRERNELSISAGINSIYSSFKRRNRNKIYEINADVHNVNKAALAYHFENQYVDNFNHFRQLMLL